MVARQGVANLTFDAVAAEAGMSKGGLLHHFRTKDRLIEALVTRAAENWRACWMGSYEKAPEGPGRMTRGLLKHCLSDAQSWTEQLRRSSSAVFAALAQNPSLIEPMRAVYSDLHRRIAEDGLPPGVGEAVVTAIDGLWLYWVLGLVPVDQELMNRLRAALEEMLARSQAERSSPKKNVRSAARSSFKIGRVTRSCKSKRGKETMNHRGWIGSSVLLATVVALGAGPGRVEICFHSGIERCLGKSARADGVGNGRRGE